MEEKKRKKKEEKKGLRSLRSEKNVWKFINKRRNKREQIKNNKISKEIWMEHFTKLLEKKQEKEELKDSIVGEERDKKTGETKKIYQEEEDNESNKISRSRKRLCWMFCAQITIHVKFHVFSQPIFITLSRK